MLWTQDDRPVSNPYWGLSTLDLPKERQAWDRVEHYIEVGVSSLYCLMKAIAQAKQFIHFTSFGMSHAILGGLMAVSTRVSVRGIVANARTDTADLIAAFSEQDTGFEVIALPPTRSASLEAPHQKLLIIDGLFAFKGSANLTLSGMSKADSARDILEYTRDITEIIEIHNKYFSRPWDELGGNDAYGGAH